jgi:hypothetical protein
MAERTKYRVTRKLWADREYEIGETVEMDAADARPLLGISLEEAGAKAEKPAPQNKAEPALETKRGPGRPAKE